MKLLTLLLALLVAILSPYLAYHHQTPLYLLTALCYGKFSTGYPRPMAL